MCSTAFGPGGNKFFDYEYVRWRHLPRSGWLPERRIGRDQYVVLFAEVNQLLIAEIRMNLDLRSTHIHTHTRGRLSGESLSWGVNNSVQRRYTARSELTVDTRTQLIVRSSRPLVGLRSVFRSNSPTDSPFQTARAVAKSGQFTTHDNALPVNKPPRLIGRLERL